MTEPRLARDAPPPRDDASALRPDADGGVEALERSADLHAVGEEAVGVHYLASQRDGVMERLRRGTMRERGQVMDGWRS